MAPHTSQLDSAPRSEPNQIDAMASGHPDRTQAGNASSGDDGARPGSSQVDILSNQGAAAPLREESAAAPGATGSEMAAAREEGAAELQVPEEDGRLEPILENLSILAHLTVFSMLGVLIRYFLEVLFGPRCLHVTDDIQALFLDIPANMLGSFIMGIVGYVAKKDIAAYSQPLAIGLSTGLCGSITTYASWNQRMMSILAYGLVARAICGYVIGTALAYYSFLVGIDAGEALKHLYLKYNERQHSRGKRGCVPRPEHYQRRWGSLALFMLLSIALWITFAVVFALDTTPPRLRKAALGCVVGPFGCWIRWFLSWLNGGGVGKRQLWKWVPVGTLAANQLAVIAEGALSAVDATHNSYMGSLAVGGVQLGFLGCMSTVSTLMQEVYALSSAKSNKWRSHAYLYLLTFLPSIVFGILVYCVPVWVFGTAANGYNKVDPWDQAYVSSVFS